MACQKWDQHNAAAESSVVRSSPFRDQVTRGIRIAVRDPFQTQLFFPWRDLTKIALISRFLTKSREGLPVFRKFSHATCECSLRSGLNSRQNTSISARLFAEQNGSFVRVFVSWCYCDWALAFCAPRGCWQRLRLGGTLPCGECGERHAFALAANWTLFRASLTAHWQGRVFSGNAVALTSFTQLIASSCLVYVLAVDLECHYTMELYGFKRKTR